VPVAHVVVEVVLVLMLIYMALFRRRSRTSHSGNSLTPQVFCDAPLPPFTPSAFHRAHAVAAQF
jgi:hypothetical protein